MCGIIPAGHLQTAGQGRCGCGFHSRHAHISSRYAENTVSKSGFYAQDCKVSHLETSGPAWPLPRHRQRDTRHSACRYNTLMLRVSKNCLEANRLSAGVFFSTYEGAKGLFGRHLPVPEPVTHSLASAVAEMASCLVLTPGEVIKQNAQMIHAVSGGKDLRKSTSLTAFRRLIATGTAGGLFTGYSALVARNLPFTALQFPLFEYIRARMWDRRLRLREDKTRGVGETGQIAGTSAALAGSLAALLTTPSDVIKTRMMVKVDNRDERNQAQQRHRGLVKVVEDVWRERGIRGFFRGGAFRCIWTAVGSGLYLGMYDAAKLWLERRK